MGLTGGIGCGKTAATSQFSLHGIQIIDADAIARQVVEPGSPALKKIIAHFGASVLSDNSVLDRQTLRHKIFKNTAEKVWLENLLHPLIRQQIKQKLEQAQPPYVVLSAPLLLETGLSKLVDRVLVIDCEPEQQISRSMQRDNSDPEAIKKIIKQQISRDQRLIQADDIITNNSTLEELQKAVDGYHRELLNKLNQ